MSYSYRGKTALITGASGGIGEVFARQLAAKGMNLILVARSEGKLRGLAEELARAHGIKADVIPSDLSKPGAAAALYAAAKAKALKVDLLLNNAGFGSFGQFETIDPKHESEMIQVNVTALVELSHTYIPEMLARGGGTVINIASGAAFQPDPYFATYGATKAFVLSFSEALWAEYRGRGVHVLCVCPGATRTGFFEATKSDEIKKIGLFSATMMTSEQVVAQSLRALERRKHYIINGWLNWLLAQSGRFSPRWMVARVSGMFMKPPASKAA
ncbi:MAG: SDR family NAD(P)-dependent oxidoreductase [Nevskiales bacterium]